jgi:hypothetical protein
MSSAGCAVSPNMVVAGDNPITVGSNQAAHEDFLNANRPRLSGIRSRDFVGEVTRPTRGEAAHSLTKELMSGCEYRSAVADASKAKSFPRWQNTQDARKRIHSATRNTPQSSQNTNRQNK